MAQRIIRTTVPRVAARARDCACANALQYAIITDAATISGEVKRDLAPIIGRYIR